MDYLENRIFLVQNCGGCANTDTGQVQHVSKNGGMMEGVTVSLGSRDEGACFTPNLSPIITRKPSLNSQTFFLKWRGQAKMSHFKFKDRGTREHTPYISFCVRPFDVIHTDKYLSVELPAVR